MNARPLDYHNSRLIVDSEGLSAMCYLKMDFHFLAKITQALQYYRSPLY